MLLFLMISLPLTVGMATFTVEGGTAAATVVTDQKREEARKIGLCYCPFDCLKPEGLRFHMITLTETDRSRLPDLEDDLKLVSKTLQHKCYSLLTGDDRELFPDLPQKNVMSASGTVGDRSKGGKRIFKVGRKEVSTATDYFVIDATGLDGFLLPCAVLLAFTFVVALVLCHKLCQAELAERRGVRNNISNRISRRRAPMGSNHAWADTSSSSALNSEHNSRGLIHCEGFEEVYVNDDAHDRESAARTASLLLATGTTELLESSSPPTNSDPRIVIRLPPSPKKRQQQTTDLTNHSSKSMCQLDLGWFSSQLTVAPPQPQPPPRPGLRLQSQPPPQPQPPPRPEGGSWTLDNRVSRHQSDFLEGKDTGNFLRGGTTTFRISRRSESVAAGAATAAVAVVPPPNGNAVQQDVLASSSTGVVSDTSSNCSTTVTIT